MNASQSTGHPVLLLVPDDAQLAAHVRRELSADSDIAVAETEDAAREALATGRPDLVLPLAWGLFFLLESFRLGCRMA